MNVIQKSSKNYSETHHSIRGPEVSREFHEVRSYSSGGDHNSNIKDNFNLEQEVQHMIPLNSSLDKNFGSLQSANMVSSVQQQKTFTTYKVQTNQYTSSGTRMVPVDFHETERTGSKLKQNIDELDTLLSDLNNAKGTTSSTAMSTSHHQQQGHISHHQNHDYNSSMRGGGGGGGATSSDDYSQSDSGFQGGQTKKTVSSFNEYNYQAHSASGDMYRKPPSPLLNKKRYPGGSPGPAHLASPNTVRRASPGQAADFVAPATSYSYNYSSSSITNNGQHIGHEPRSSRPDYNDKPSYRLGSPHTPDIHRSSPSPSGPRVPSSPRDGTPTGTSYYSKYHSTQSHQSQRSNNGPMAFPTNTPPRHHGSQTIQSPPKRVDELMSELADFDPSIKPSDIVEPTPTRARRVMDIQTRDNQHFDEHESGRKYNNYQRSPSPARHSKQPSTPGPPVYYPPGEVFASTKSKSMNQASSPLATQAPERAVAEHGYVEGGRGKASMRQEYGYKDKSRHQESDSKGGAAVVPICLPLCCAAPCVIM